METFRYKIDWANLRLEGKFKKKLCYRNIFALFYFVFGTIYKYKPSGAYIRRGDLTAGCLGDIFWRGLFSEFFFHYAILNAE